MLANIGVPGLILIIVLALIVFGPKRLPEMGRAVGQTLTEFKKSTQNLMGNDKESTNNSEITASNVNVEEKQPSSQN